MERVATLTRGIFWSFVAKLGEMVEQDIFEKSDIFVSGIMAKHGLQVRNKLCS